MSLLEKFPAMKLVWLAAAAFCVMPVAGALIDWEDGIWTHGGPAQTGYGAGQASGSTSDGGVNVTVSYQAFGTAVLSHSGLGGAQPQVRADFNGGVTDGALSLGIQSDRNTGLLANYGLFTIVFSAPVNLLSFIVGDVDTSTTAGTPWQDYVAVAGRLGGAGGTPRTTTYATSSTNTSQAYLGLNGVSGTAAASNSSNAGEVGVSFSGTIDFLQIYYLQGPLAGVAAAQHGIYLPDISFSAATSVPEPGTFLLLGAGLIALGLFGRRR
jgi:hypothetical protein